eukprot:scaffold55159_cov58-Cyclotella_meneghiniana.AAC.1
MLVTKTHVPLAAVAPPLAVAVADAPIAVVVVNPNQLNLCHGACIDCAMCRSKGIPDGIDDCTTILEVRRVESLSLEVQYSVAELFSAAVMIFSGGGPGGGCGGGLWRLDA